METQSFVKLSFFVLSLGTAIVSNAQYGVGARYTAMHDSYWEEVFRVSESNYSNQLIAAQLLYWFRLKEKRIEFLPEIGYARSVSSTDPLMFKNRLSAISLALNTDIYFLDLANDCNCPTFSKQGNHMKRGLFVEVSTGVEFRKLSIDYPDVNGETATRIFTQTAPRVYAGLGFDIGISDLITITPNAGIGMLFNSHWDGVVGFLDTEGSSNVSGSNREWSNNVGLRLLLRPDYIRTRR